MSEANSNSSGSAIHSEQKTIGTNTSRPLLMNSGPSLFKFDDYRKFLAAWMEWKRSTQSSYSGSVFAKRAGLSSHSLVGMVIRGERNLSATTIRGFSKALNLSPKDALVFEKMVLFNQAQNSEDKAFYLDQLVHLSRGQGKTLITKIKDHSTLASDWFYPAIRELVAHPEFKPEGEWISKKLKKKITPKQAEEAWESLIELHLVEKDLATEKYRPVHPSLDIDPGQIDFAIRNYHRKMLERTQASVDGESVNERELSSLTMSVCEEDLPKLRQKINDFRKNLNLEFPLTDAPRTHVVAVNTQVLVLTEAENQNRRMK